MEPNLVLITAASISGAIGVALIFVGVLMAILIALGNKHYLYALIIFLFFPAAFVFGFQYRKDSDYSVKLLSLGLAAFTVFFALMWWELNRLGLDFFSVVASAKPVH